jgi:hypothetical protein
MVKNRFEGRPFFSKGFMNSWLVGELSKRNPFAAFPTEVKESTSTTCYVPSLGVVMQGG